MLKKYQYIGNPGNYTGISVVPGEVYEFEKTPNPKLFELVGEEKVEQIKRPIVVDDVYTVMEEIHGIGKKAAEELAEEYSDLEELKKDIENGSFSVGGMSEKKIELIKKELNIGGR